jgi:hypothetical protein
MNGVSPAQGIQNWMSAFNRAATTVTRSTAVDTDSSASTSDSLTDGMVGLGESAAGVHAAIQVIKTQDQMLGSIVDMLA